MAWLAMSRIVSLSPTLTQTNATSCVENWPWSSVSLGNVFLTIGQSEVTNVSTKAR